MVAKGVKFGHNDIFLETNDNYVLHPNIPKPGYDNMHQYVVSFTKIHEQMFQKLRL